MDERLVREFFRGIRPRRVRTMREFAEQEIVIPPKISDERYAGRPWSAEFIPLLGPILDEFSSGRWRRFFAVAAGQSTKTFTFFCIPALYFLFEIQEPVAVGLPNIDAAKAIWLERLVPVIERTRYRDLLPSRGVGSRGGRTSVLYFRHGPFLRFMGAGGKDIQRASHSARIVLATEIEEMQSPGGASVEASPLASFEARSRGFGEAARFWGESIVTTAQGIAWREAMVQGSGAEIYIRCPHCQAFVLPGREHLHGVDEAETELQAAENARWACPGCGVLWDEADRLRAIREVRLVHRGQAVDAQGRVTGPLPPTQTFGVRWSALHTPLTTLGKVAVEEWKARQSELAAPLQALYQYTWAQPWTPDAEAGGPPALSANAIRDRVSAVPRGQVPAGTEQLTVGIDIGKHVSQWAAPAFAAGAGGVVADYGVIETWSEQLSPEVALLNSLRDFAEQVLQRGFEDFTTEAQRTQSPDSISPAEQKTADLGATREPVARMRRPDLVLIDSGYLPDVVYQFCAEQRTVRCLPSKGFGTRRGQTGWHRQRSGANVRMGPDGDWALVRLPSGQQLVEYDADAAKRWLHQRLVTPAAAPGSLLLFRPEQKLQHMSFAKHLTAEREVEEFTPAGRVVKWVQQNANNHWLDALSLAGLAARMLGARVIAAARAGEGGGAVKRRSWSDRLAASRQKREGGRR